MVFDHDDNLFDDETIASAIGQADHSVFEFLLRAVAHAGAAVTTLGAITGAVLLKIHGGPDWSALLFALAAILLTTVTVAAAKLIRDVVGAWSRFFCTKILAPPTARLTNAGTYTRARRPASQFRQRAVGGR